MDIVDFVEMYWKVELLEYQKRLLRKIGNMPSDIQILFGRRGFIMVVPRDKEKNTELTQTSQQGLRAQTYIIDELEVKKEKR